MNKKIISTNKIKMDKKALLKNEYCLSTSWYDLCYNRWRCDIIVNYDQ